MFEIYDHAQVMPFQDSATAEAGRFRTVFLRVAPAMFLATLDQTFVAAALPVIGSSLGSLAQVAWVVTAYLLAAKVAAPVYGRMGDAFGCKRMLLWALSLFLAGSIACAAARSRFVGWTRSSAQISLLTGRVLIISDGHFGLSLGQGLAAFRAGVEC